MNSFLVNVGRHQLSDLGVDGIVCVNYLVYLVVKTFKIGSNCVPILSSGHLPGLDFSDWFVVFL